MSNFRNDIKVFIDANLSPAARSHTLAATARSERDKLIQSGQANRRYITYVDGRRDDNEDDVKGTGGGIINYQFSFLGDAIEFAVAFLRNRVPRLTGRLSQSWWISVNGDYIPPGASVDYASIPFDAEVVIGNTAAYWRKADVNVKGRTTLKYRTPNELNDCVRALGTEFGRSSISATRLNDYNFPDKYRQKNAGYNFTSPVIVIKETR